MRIVPAVDIRGGLCVNLVQGDYAQETVFSDDPVAQAVEWHAQGGALVHIVDLDGAKEGQCCIEAQLRAMAEQNVPLEVGGGVRNIETVAALIDFGAERVILGTAAHDSPDFLQQAAKEFPDRIAVGIDARDGKVAVNAWVDVTQTDAIEFAKRVEQAGVSRIIYTDILSDGMMKGPNVDATGRLAEAVAIPVTASGGVSTLDDIRDLRELESAGVDETIVGRALYLGSFTIKEASAIAAGES